MTKESNPHLLRAEQIEALPERQQQHQFNANAVRQTRSLGDLLGLQALGVHLVRLESGRDSTQFHFHDTDEEFLYILSGRGIAEIGEQRLPVGAGDFMAFPAGSEPHCLSNPHSEDLLYLMGGDRNVSDVVHYPHIGRTMIKSAGSRRWVATAQLKDVAPKE